MEGIGEFLRNFQTFFSGLRIMGVTGQCMDKPNLNQRIILVVEDEERNWFILRDIIQFCNGKALWAESAMEGINIATQNKDVELVLMDIRLPFISGIEATKRIKAILPNLPIVAQTAFTEKNQISEYIDAGCDDCIFKPIDFKVLVALLEKYLLH